MFCWVLGSLVDWIDVRFFFFWFLRVGLIWRKEGFGGVLEEVFLSGSLEVFEEVVCVWIWGCVLGY